VVIGLAGSDPSPFIVCSVKKWLPITSPKMQQHPIVITNIAVIEERDEGMSEDETGETHHHIPILIYYFRVSTPTTAFLGDF